MSEKVADVLLVTDDAHLREAVVRQRRVGARLQLLGSNDLASGSAPRARQVWIDLDSASGAMVGGDQRRVYFHSQQPPATQKLPPGLFIRKPCNSSVLEVLWAGVEVKPGRSSKSPPRPSGRLLPAWLLDYHELDLKALCRKCVTGLGPRLGYQDGSLYLFDAEHGLLTLAETTHTRPIDLAVRFDAEDPHLMTAVARSGEMLRTERVSTELAVRHIARHDERPYSDEGCLVVPLVSEGQLWGLLSFSGHARTTHAEVGLPLDEIFAFIARSLAHACTYERARLEARVDGLTGLYNQRWMTETLAKEIRRARRFATPLAVLMLDLDGLKAINDRAGHAAGDCLLRHIASRISAVLRQFDGAARVGGDEFVVMLPATPLDGAQHVAQRLLQSIREDVAHFEGCPLPITASVGAAEWRTDWDAKQLIDAADRAMYAAKGHGRNALACQPADPLPTVRLGASAPYEQRVAPTTRFTPEPSPTSLPLSSPTELTASPPRAEPATPSWRAGDEAKGAH
jgi:diguanylate cyclase (GGDEF)-like protein